MQLTSICKKCRYIKSDEWRKNNPERVAASREKTKKNNPGYHRGWKRASKEKYRENGLKRLYGVTLELYSSLLAEQGGVCAICLSSDPAGKGSFCVDHDHRTGVVRGLLCSRCNSILGYAKDNPETLARGSVYLIKHKGDKTEGENNAEVLDNPCPIC